MLGLEPRSDTSENQIHFFKPLLSSRSSLCPSIVIVLPTNAFIFGPTPSVAFQSSAPSGSICWTGYALSPSSLAFPFSVWTLVVPCPTSQSVHMFEYGIISSSDRDFWRLPKGGLSPLSFFCAISEYSNQCIEFWVLYTRTMNKIEVKFEQPYPPAGMSCGSVRPVKYSHERFVVSCRSNSFFFKIWSVGSPRPCSAEALLRNLDLSEMHGCEQKGLVLHWFLSLKRF